MSPKCLRVLSSNFKFFVGGIEDTLFKARTLNSGPNLRFITLVLTALHSCANIITLVFALKILKCTLFLQLVTSEPPYK